MLPCFNEQEAIPKLAESIASAFANQGTFEVTVLFVDDGSDDETWAAIVDQGSKFPELVAGLRLNINYGKARAQACGIEACANDFDFIALLDGDGQHDVRALPKAAAQASLSGLPQIARREHHRRSVLNAAGTRLLHLVTRVMGITYDPDLAEYVVMPRMVAARVVRSIGFGTAPIVPVVTSSGQRFEEFPSAVLDRIGDFQYSRWPMEDLVRKALMHIFIDPWRLVIRTSVVVALVTSMLGLYGLVIGISSIARGDFMGIASVIIVVVGTFVVLALLSVAIMGLVVTQTAFANRQEYSSKNDIWRHSDADSR